MNSGIIIHFLIISNFLNVESSNTNLILIIKFYNNIKKL
jgi:hypothetical protein